ncbi:MAG: Crp/Fnr family transcriptional regulator [Burkholderiales bacterium]|nr:Crp/Fnr family transcriptional regulator [Burkholderiales bacterium]
MLRTAPWANTLAPADLARVEGETVVRTCASGTLVCRKGEPAAAWVGVVEGLVKMTNVSAGGKPTSFVGVGSGGWFGEGSLLKDEPRRYDIVALRESVIAYMPKATFLWLLDTSMAFNRCIITQLNERLGQFIGMVEHDRLLGPEARLAHCLASMFNPVLYPGVRLSLPISQEEIAQLAGLSRQRANQALQRLEQAGLVRIDYGGVTVRDLAGLRQYQGADGPERSGPKPLQP